MFFTDVPQDAVTLEAAIVALINIAKLHEQEINGAKNFVTEVTDVLNEFSQRLDYLRLLVQEALTLSDEDFVQDYAAFTEAEFDPLEAITRQDIEALGLDLGDLDLAAFDSAAAVDHDFGLKEDLFEPVPEASEDDADEAEVVCDYPLCYDYGDAEAAYEAGYAAGIKDAKYKCPDCGFWHAATKR